MRLRGVGLAIFAPLALVLAAPASATVHGVEERVQGPGTAVGAWAEECTARYCDAQVEVTRAVQHCPLDPQDDTATCTDRLTTVFRERLGLVNASPSTPDTATYPWSCSRTGRHFWRVTVTQDRYEPEAHTALIGSIGGAFTVPRCQGRRAYPVSGRAAARWAARHLRSRGYSSVDVNCIGKRKRARWVCGFSYTEPFAFCAVKIVVKATSTVTFGKRSARYSLRRSGSRTCIGLL